MFEKFTEKAINVVSEAQRFAKEMKCSEVYPEHVLLALVSEAKGVSLKLFRMFDMTADEVMTEVAKHSITSSKSAENLPFNYNVKELLKRTVDMASKSGNSNILFEHLFLAVVTEKNSNIQAILDHFNFDVNSSREILNKLVQKKIKRLEHPEGEMEEERAGSFESLYEGEAVNAVFDRAVSKLSTSGYEILGTEQIIASILEDENSALNEIMSKYGLNSTTFEEKLSGFDSRQSEFEGRKVIFTPNAFMMMNAAIETAKELGSSEVTPEHIILSVLKTRKGLAYNVIKSLGVNEEKLSSEILKPIEKQMPETLLIMKLAKEEARRIGRNVVGTEMFLLGIIGEGASVASEVLNNLEITMKDARLEVENLVGFGNEYFDKEIIFTKRAKRVLEKAWLSAKKVNKQRIEAVDLLLAIIEEPDSLAMKVLDNLGVDAIEIKHGIQGIK